MFHTASTLKCNLVYYNSFLFGVRACLNNFLVAIDSDVKTVTNIHLVLQ